MSDDTSADDNLLVSRNRFGEAFARARGGASADRAVADAAASRRMTRPCTDPSRPLTMADVEAHFDWIEAQPSRFNPAIAETRARLLHDQRWMLHVHVGTEFEADAAAAIIAKWPER